MAHSSPIARFLSSLKLLLPTAHALEDVPPDIHSEAKDAYYVSHKAVTEGLYSSRLHKNKTVWKQLDAFCAWICILTDLQGILKPIPFLQIFSRNVPTGILAAKHKPIQKRSVEKYIRSVGKIFEALRFPDPKINAVGAIDFCLGQQFVNYKK